MKNELLLMLPVIRVCRDMGTSAFSLQGPTMSFPSIRDDVAAPQAYCWSVQYGLGGSWWGDIVLPILFGEGALESLPNSEFSSL